MSRTTHWLAVLVIVACGCMRSTPTAAPMTGAGGRPLGARNVDRAQGMFAFDFTLPDLDGKSVSLADYKGKVLIVDIWGTWCPPCRMEIPHFIELKKRYAEKGFDIVGINYENSQGDAAKQTIADFVKENGINYTCVIGDEATQKQIRNLEGYPTTLFIDRAGKVRNKVVGYHEIAALEAMVSELLAEEAPMPVAGNERSEAKDDEETTPTDSADGTKDEVGDESVSTSDDESVAEVDDESAPADPIDETKGAKDADGDENATTSDDEAAAAKDVDQLLQEAQKLAQKQDIDGMLRVLKQAIEVDPKNRQVLTILCSVLQYQAVVVSQTDDPKKAYPKYKDGAGYARTLRDAYDDLSPDELALVASFLYNEACAYGIDDDADKALASLLEAVDAGFADADQLAKDADLALLRDRPEFKELQDRVVQKSEERAREEAEQARAAEEQTLEEVKRQLAKAETFPFDFTLNDLDDEPVSLADYKGKVVIVDIWGTWCPPCRMEIPHFIELKKRYADKGFDIVGINYESSDDDQAKEAIADFVKENGINYKCVLGDEETQRQVPEFEGFPTTLFIDRAGKVRLKLVGLHPLAALECVVKELLADEAAPAESDDESGDDEEL
jgi:thiol-disulfide isomerase/thioredoxin